MAKEKIVYSSQLLYKKSAGGVQVWRTWVVDEDGVGVIHREYGKVDGKKTVTTDRVTAGKNAGRKNATTPVQQAVADATSDFTEKLSRKGYDTDVGVSAGKVSASPMLAQPIDKVKKLEFGEAFVQPKLDGFRMLASLTDDGQIRLVTREGQPFDTVPHIAEQLQKVLRPGIVLDGEVYHHDALRFQGIASAAKRLQEDSLKLQYHVYDMFGTDPFRVRYEVAKELIKSLPSVFAVTTAIVANRDELDIATSKFIDQGYEGSILRIGRSGYESGKRSYSLLKYKKFDDAEFTIVDFKEGRGNYAGAAIFTCTTSKGHFFDVTAPGNMEQKREALRQAPKLKGKKLTVKFFGYTEKDKPVPRMPVAKWYVGDIPKSIEEAQVPDDDSED